MNPGEVGTLPEGTFPVLPLSPEKGQAPFGGGEVNFLKQRVSTVTTVNNEWNPGVMHPSEDQLEGGSVIYRSYPNLQVCDLMRTGVL